MLYSDAVDFISMDKIKSHWDAQAKTYLDSPKATFNDIFLMEKEIRLLSQSVHDLLPPLQHLGTFDVIICKRVLINLVNRENQLLGLNRLHRVLKPHGTLLLSEANEDAWRRLNVLRRRFGLEALGKPWYNRYGRNDELCYFIKDNFSLRKGISF